MHARVWASGPLYALLARSQEHLLAEKKAWIVKQREDEGQQDSLECAAMQLLL